MSGISCGREATVGVPAPLALAREEEGGEGHKDGAHAGRTSSCHVGDSKGSCVEVVTAAKLD